MRTVVASFPNMRDRVDVTDSTGIALPSERDVGLVGRAPLDHPHTVLPWRVIPALRRRGMTPNQLRSFQRDKGDCRPVPDLALSLVYGSKTLEAVRCASASRGKSKRIFPRVVKDFTSAYTGHGIIV